MVYVLRYTALEEVKVSGVVVPLPYENPSCPQVNESGTEPLDLQVSDTKTPTSVLMRDGDGVSIIGDAREIIII